MITNYLKSIIFPLLPNNCGIVSNFMNLILMVGPQRVKCIHPGKEADYFSTALSPVTMQRRQDDIA